MKAALFTLVPYDERIELGQAVMTHGQERGWSYHSWATHWMPLPSLPNPTTQAEGGAA